MFLPSLRLQSTLLHIHDAIYFIVSLVIIKFIPILTNFRFFMFFFVIIFLHKSANYYECMQCLVDFQLLGLLSEKELLSRKLDLR